MTSFDTGFIYGVKSDGSQLELSARDNFTVLDNLALGRVLHISNSSSSLVYNVSEQDGCLQSFEKCHQSFGASFWLFVVNVTECVVFDSVTDGTTGIIISVEDNK